jgi:hypothetical protein
MAKTRKISMMDKERAVQGRAIKDKDRDIWYE